MKLYTSRIKEMSAILLSLFILACEGNEKNIPQEEIIVKEKVNSTINLSIYDAAMSHPSSYQHVFSIDSNGVMNVSGKSYFVDDEMKTIKLSNESRDSLQYYVELIGDYSFLDTASYSQTGRWVAEIRIDDELIYHYKNFRYSYAPKEIKDLIDFIIKVSPLKIKEYGFGYPTKNW